MLKLKLEGEIVRKTVEKIIEDIKDRGGLGDEWEQIDESIQEEIKEKWESIILELLTYYVPRIQIQ